MNMKKLLKRNEFYVILIIVVLSLLIQMKSGQFFTANNIVDLVRSLIVPGMMAAGLFYGYRLREHRCIVSIYGNAVYVCCHKMVSDNGL